MPDSCKGQYVFISVFWTSLLSLLVQHTHSFHDTRFWLFWVWPRWQKQTQRFKGYNSLRLSVARMLCTYIFVPMNWLVSDTNRAFIHLRYSFFLSWCLLSYNFIVILIVFKCIIFCASMYACSVSYPFICVMNIIKWNFAHNSVSFTAILS